ncbi:SUMF1/EgtB/PvdO family nonheme iron enzyme [Flectobacillus roseus]
MVGISWNDAVVYCKLLSSKTGKSYCLSTGAEQKYAACGRQSSNGNVYSDCTNIENVGCNDSYSDLHNMWSEANKPPKNFHQLDNGRSYTNIS